MKECVLPWECAEELHVVAHDGVALARRERLDTHLEELLGIILMLLPLICWRGSEHFWRNKISGVASSLVKALAALKGTYDVPCLQSKFSVTVFLSL